MSLFYSSRKVRKSIEHFVTGRVLSSLISFFVTIVIIREMPIDGYAQYAILLGFTAIIGAATSLALEHVGQRYIPELIIRHQLYSAYLLFWFLFLIRTFILIVVLLVVTYFSSTMQYIYPALEKMQNVLWVWCGMTFFVTAFKSVLLFLEVFLHQKIVKWLSVSLAGLRLLLLFLVMEYSPNISIEAVLYLDSIAHAMVLLPAIIYLLNCTKVSEKKNELDADSFDARLLSRMWNYVKYSSLREFVYLFSAPAANRLVVGRTQFGSDMATYGVAQSLYDFIERYTPSVFLTNIIKPVIVAKYVENQSYKQVSEYGNLIIKFNFLFIFPFIFIFTVYGTELSLLISNDKYSSVGFFLSALLIILAYRGHYYFLELHVTVSEKMGILLVASIIMSLWVVPAIILTPILGVWGLVLSRLVFMMIRDVFVVVALRRQKIKCAVELRSILLLLLSFGLLTVIAVFIKEYISTLFFLGILLNILLLLIVVSWLMFYSSYFNSVQYELIKTILGTRWLKHKKV